MTRTPVAQLRQLFLDYFAAHGHTIVKSSPLVPANDPTLMFTNAGMVQFKDVFVGQEKRPYVRATSCQKCMRVSGKHNDLEEVGRTARHHTLFEMLGNFSFGDYFKKEAIAFAWEFLTRDMALDRKRLWVTVFGGEGKLAADGEARALWRKISGLGDDRILDKGMKENFWAMGETGPCGPCTEIHFDTGKGPVSPEDFDNGRVVEIWNNVFMQFERHADGTLTPLPKPCVDTGMGLERLAAVVSGETSNYHTDLFLPILDCVAQMAKKAYRRSDSEDDVSMRVIADHARAASFLVADGIQPSNEGRGYVMRRIMRRAIRHGRRLGLEDVFFHRACEAVVDSMHTAYPELNEARTLITKVAETEERGFRRTLDSGLRILDEEIAHAKSAGHKTLPGETVFRLYDTYGFPKDLTELVAREHSLGIDEDGFGAHMENQRERSRASEVGGAAVKDVYKSVAQALGEVQFVGYTHEDEPLSERAGAWRIAEHDSARFIETQSTIKALIVDGAQVSHVKSGPFELVLDPTPFYGESGGQVGDSGILLDDGVLARITDSQKPKEGLIVSLGTLLRGEMKVGQKVWAGYPIDTRKNTRRQHSATHLLHAALRQVLGSHVNQAGSLVDPHHLRFDYTHFEAPTTEQLRAVEAEANERVAGDFPVQTQILAFDQAKAHGAIALFGEKYGDRVRMVSMGKSIELCGGTHARRTGDIGMVLITHEQAVASGVRRIEAVCGEPARQSTRKTAKLLVQAADMVARRRPPAAEADQPILLAVAKAVKTADELAQALRKLGKQPVTTDTTQVTEHELGSEVSLPEARQVRDAWQALVQLVNARGAEVEAASTRAAMEDSGGLVAAMLALQQANRDNERMLHESSRQQVTSQLGDLLAKAKEVAGIRCVASQVEGADAKNLRELADQLRSKLGSGVVCLGTRDSSKASLLVAVTSDLTSRFKAGVLVQELAPVIGGKGGGRPEMAQAGGNRPEALDEAFARFREILARP